MYEPKILWDVEVIRSDSSKSTDEDYLCFGCSKSDAFSKIMKIVGVDEAYSIMGRCYVDENTCETYLDMFEGFEEGDKLVVAYREEYDELN